MRTDNILNWIDDIGTTDGASGVLLDFRDLFIFAISEWGGSFTTSQLNQIKSALNRAIMEVQKIEKQ